MNVREALEFAKKNRVQVVDLKFVDLIGTWQHFTIPASELTEDLFKDGSGLDGSSIRGWKPCGQRVGSLPRRALPCRSSLVSARRCANCVRPSGVPPRRRSPC